MERIFLVKGDDLSEVNEWLQKGGKVKMIVSEPAPRDYSYEYLFAYVVVEFD